MKKIDDLFISESALLAYLLDMEFPKSNLYSIRKKNNGNLPLVYSEPYVGIAIDKKTRSSKDKHLYNIERLRLGNEVNLWLEISGIPSDFEIPSEKAILRLGGEGKQAISRVESGISLDSTGIVDRLSKTGYLKIVLLQHADFGGNWYPPDFIQEEQDGQVSWVGEIDGISMNMISACVGKPVYIGGWDISKRKPRTSEPHVPAGSTFYMKIDPADSTKAVNAIHDQHIGLKTNLGFGHAAVGVWNNE
jgi:CRISPR-associated protein Cmr3